MTRRYTLTEANQVLKLVRVIAAEMLERRGERRHLARERTRLESANTPEGLRSELAELDARIWEHDDALRSCRHELEELGLTVLRASPLTIHIPGRSLPAQPRRRRLLERSRAGRVSGDDEAVVFCWQEGEGDLCFGHAEGQEEHQRRPLRVAKGA